MLVSDVQQSESATYAYIPFLMDLPPTSSPPYASKSSQNTKLDSGLYYSFPLAIYFIHGSVYMSVQRG